MPHPAEEKKKGKENFWFLLPRPKGADEARIIGHQGSARNAVELCLIHTARNRNRILKPKWGRAEGATLMHFPPTPSQFAATRRHFLNPTSPASRSGASLSELEVSFCGAFWLKSELFLTKIRTANFDAPSCRRSETSPPRKKVFFTFFNLRPPDFFF